MLTFHTVCHCYNYSDERQKFETEGKEGLGALSLVRIAMSPLTLLKIVVRPLSAMKTAVELRDQTTPTEDHV